MVGLLAFVIASLSCGKPRTIPENDMVKILSKIYITDGITFLPEKHTLFGRDTIAYYEPIIESYGYTTQQFDSSMKYYAYHTEKLDEIFDRVVIELSKMEEQVRINPKNLAKDQSVIPDTVENLWPHKSYWNMAVDYGQNRSLGFDVPVKGLGDYTLSFDAQLFPDDSSVECRMNAFWFIADNVQRDYRDVAKVQLYPKDGVVHHYSFTFSYTDDQYTHLKGWLYDNANKNQNFNRHAVFNNIRITYKPVSKSPVRALKDEKPLKVFKKPVPVQR